MIADKIWMIFQLGVSVALVVLLVLGVYVDVTGQYDRQDACEETCFPEQPMRKDSACYCAVPDGRKLEYKDADGATQSK